MNSTLIALHLMQRQRTALMLEIAGMKHSSGRSMYAHIKRVHKLKGNKESVYNQFAQLVAKKEEEAGCFE